MMELYNKNVLCLFLGTLSWLLLFSYVNADGRVFLLDLRNSSAPQGLGAAEHACASYDARLASAEELRHAVVECSFSACTHGWLFGGTVGTTVCNNVGSALKAVDVKIKNTTEGTEYLNAFCVKDKGVPCGDPPSFPNTRLQGHTGFEMGDELLYTCVPGHVMPSGHRAFSLLCDSCGEWYGLVQLCVRDHTETHIDYEDKFTDTYGDPEEHSEEKLHEEAQGEVHEEVHEAPFDEDHAEKGHSQEQQEASFTVEDDQRQEEEMGGEELSVDEEDEEEREVGEENAEMEEQEEVEDFTQPPGAEQEHEEVAGREVTEWVEMTEAPVSLISQKHMFWFPSEAFPEEGHLAPTQPPLTQTTLPEGDNRVRASGGQSEESKEYDSQEGHDEQPDDHEENEPSNYGEHEGDHHVDRDEAEDGHHNDQDDPEDSHHHDHDDTAHDDEDDHDDGQHDDRDDPEDSQSEDHDENAEHDDHDKHYIPSQQEEELEKGGRYEDRDDHDDHYDMGEHEEDDRHRVHHGSQGEHEDPDDDHSEDHDHDDVTDGHQVDDHHDDQDDGDKEEDHHYDHEHHERDHEHNEDHEHEDHDSYDHDDHDDHDRVPLVITTTDEPLNVTNVGTGEDPTTSTDETWLDGYPVVPDETEKVGGGSTAEEGTGPEQDIARGVPDSPNEVEMSQPAPYTSPPQVQESTTREPYTVEQGAENLSPSPFPGSPEPSDYNTDDYSTPTSPTDSWVDTTGGHPFLDHGLVPTAHTDDVVTATGELDVGHAEHNLTGQVGERGDVEGEMGETTCVDEDCPSPPPPSSGRGPTVAAVIVAVCAVAAAAVAGAWCYRRRQQKSSMYEMNGKGQGQSRQGQQIEMQQKV